MLNGELSTLFWIYISPFICLLTRYISHTFLKENETQEVPIGKVPTYVATKLYPSPTFNFRSKDKPQSQIQQIQMDGSFNFKH